MKTSIPLKMVKRGPYPDDPLFAPDESVVKQYEHLLDLIPLEIAQCIDMLVADIVRCRNYPLSPLELYKNSEKLKGRIG